MVHVQVALGEIAIGPVPRSMRRGWPERAQRSERARSSVPPPAPRRRVRLARGPRGWRRRRFVAFPRRRSWRAGGARPPTPAGAAGCEVGDARLALGRRELGVSMKRSSQSSRPARNSSAWSAAATMRRCSSSDRRFGRGRYCASFSAT
jgi:hypothetical protein